MPDFTITLSNKEVLALRAQLGPLADVQVWVENALKNKARKAALRLIEKITNKNPKRLTMQEISDEIDAWEAINGPIPDGFLRD